MTAQKLCKKKSSYLVSAFTILTLSILFCHADDSTQEGCVSAFMYVEEHGDSVMVMGVSGGGVTREIVRLINYSLPTVGCEPNFEHCELQCFPCTQEEDSGEDQCCTFPVVNQTGGNELTLLRVRWLVGNESQCLDLREYVSIAHGLDCVTAHMYIPPSGQHLVGCINTTANTTEDLAYVLFFILSYDGDSINTTANLERSGFVIFPRFPDALSLSESLYVQQPRGCPSPHIFFVASSMGYTVRINDDGDVFGSVGKITDCRFPLDIGYLEVEPRGLLLRVQCSEHITKLFASCTQQVVVATYDSRINGTVYQCTGEDIPQVNLTLRGGYINLTTTGNIQDLGNIGVSHYFPFTANISYGYCDIGSDVNFVFGHHNGSVFSLSFTTGEISSIAHNSCDDATDRYARGHCYKVHRTNTRDTALVYDYQDFKFKVVNLTCPESPVVESTLLSPRPPMITYLQGPGSTHKCPNTSVDNVTTSSISYSLTVSSTVNPTSESQGVSNVNPTSESQGVSTVSSPMIDKTSSSVMSTPVLSSSPTTSTSPGKYKLKHPQLLALLTLFVIPIIIIIIMCCKPCRKCLSKKESSFEQTEMTSNNVNRTGACPSCTDGKESPPTDEGSSKDGSPGVGATTPLLNNSTDVLVQDTDQPETQSGSLEQSTIPDGTPPPLPHGASHSSHHARRTSGIAGPNPGKLLCVDDATTPPSPGPRGSQQHPHPLSLPIQRESSSFKSDPPPSSVSTSPFHPPVQTSAASNVPREDVPSVPPGRRLDCSPRREQSSSARESMESRGSRSSLVNINPLYGPQHVNVHPATESGNSPAGHIVTGQLQSPPSQQQLQQQPQQPPLQPDPETGQPHQS